MSKHVNIASVNVATCKYRIAQPWSLELLTSPLGEPSYGNFCVFYAKNSLESFREIALKNLEFRNLQGVRTPYMYSFTRCLCLAAGLLPSVMQRHPDDGFHRRPRLRLRRQSGDGGRRADDDAQLTVVRGQWLKAASYTKMTAWHISVKIQAIFTKIYLIDLCQKRWGFEQFQLICIIYAHLGSD